MKTTKAYRLETDDYMEYQVPSLKEAHTNMRETWGKQYDFIERKKVEGGIPQPFARSPS